MVWELCREGFRAYILRTSDGSCLHVFDSFSHCHDMKWASQGPPCLALVGVPPGTNLSTRDSLHESNSTLALIDIHASSTDHNLSSCTPFPHGAPPLVALGSVTSSSHSDPPAVRGCLQDSSGTSPASSPLARSYASTAVQTTPGYADGASSSAPHGECSQPQALDSWPIHSASSLYNSHRQIEGNQSLLGGQQLRSHGRAASTVRLYKSSIPWCAMAWSPNGRAIVLMDQDCTFGDILDARAAQPIALSTCQARLTGRDRGWGWPQWALDGSCVFQPSNGYLVRHPDLSEVPPPPPPPPAALTIEIGSLEHLYMVFVPRDFSKAAMTTPFPLRCLMIWSGLVYHMIAHLEIYIVTANVVQLLHAEGTAPRGAGGPGGGGGVLWELRAKSVPYIMIHVDCWTMKRQSQQRVSWLMLICSCCRWRKGAKMEEAVGCRGQQRIPCPIS